MPASAGSGEPCAAVETRPVAAPRSCPWRRMSTGARGCRGGCSSLGSLVREQLMATCSSGTVPSTHGTFPRTGLGRRSGGQPRAVHGSALEALLLLVFLNFFLVLGAGKHCMMIAFRHRWRRSAARSRTSSTAPSPSRRRCWVPSMPRSVARLMLAVLWAAPCPPPRLRRCGPTLQSSRPSSRSRFRVSRRPTTLWQSARRIPRWTLLSRGAPAAPRCSRASLLLRCRRSSVAVWRGGRAMVATGSLAAQAHQV
mmetsp:Transcript_45388/g.117840  ORF Transcript_45388/g.117840 Transcript_45388/m.117840 type:complete len:254 (-) Transcript_45388:391-1152(-)